MAVDETTERPKRKLTAAMEAAKWKPGQGGGGHALGGAKTAIWRKAINEAVTEDDCADVIRAMKSRSCGVEVQKTDKKTGETSIFTEPPCPTAARLFFEVLGVLSKDNGDKSELEAMLARLIASASPEQLAALESELLQ